MATMTSTDKTLAVRDYAAQTCGTEHFHRHGLNRRFLYTDGAKFVAETCGAHWLLDAIASHQLGARVRREEFQVWTLRAGNADGVRLVCTNGNDETAIVQQFIGFSDFPRELLPFKLWVERSGEGMVCMLPEER